MLDTHLLLHTNLDRTAKRTFCSNVSAMFQGGGEQFNEFEEKFSSSFVPAVVEQHQIA